MQIFVASYFENTPLSYTLSADQISLHFPFLEITLEADCWQLRASAQSALQQNSIDRNRSQMASQELQRIKTIAKGTRVQ